MSNTLQSLLDQWQGMNFLEKQYRLLRDVFGYGWWRSRVEDDYWAFSLHRPTFGDWEYEEAAPDWLNLRDERDERYHLSIGTVIRRSLYVHEDSPRSLVSALEQKTIEKTGPYSYLSALMGVLEIDGAPGHYWPHKLLEEIVRATADQRCCACWIAVMLERGE